MVGSDAVIALSYFTITGLLLALVRQAKLPFGVIFWAFGLFIGACGLTHVFEIVTLWQPVYWWAAGVKVTTALASFLTAALVLQLRPQLMGLTRAAQLATERGEALALAYQELEGRVAERTQDLATAHAQLVEREASFRQLADVLPQIVWVANPAGKIEYFNRRWYLYAQNAAGQSTAESWTDLLHPSDAEACLKTWAQALACGEAFEGEYRLLSPSQEEACWFLGRAEPVFDSQGRLERWFGTWTDIDAQRRSLAVLHEALKLRDQFLLVASHELKTPMTSLRLQLQLLGRTSSQNPDQSENEAASRERRSRQLKVAQRQVHRLGALVTELLDVSRIQAGRMDLHLEQLDLSALVEEVIERCLPELEEARCPVETDIAPNLWALGDGSRLEQALLNLLSNAAKYARGTKVSVALSQQAEDIHLSVQDEGPGIPLDKQALIFERFERAVSARHVSGLGLGLFIARHIVHLHQGRLWVTSKPNEGACFVIVLPQKKNSSETPGPQDI